MITVRVFIVIYSIFFSVHIMGYLPCYLYFSIQKMQNLNFSSPPNYHRIQRFFCLFVCFGKSSLAGRPDEFSGAMIQGGGYPASPQDYLHGPDSIRLLSPRPAQGTVCLCRAGLLCPDRHGNRSVNASASQPISLNLQMKEKKFNIEQRNTISNQKKVQQNILLLFERWILAQQSQWE